MPDAGTNFGGMPDERVGGTPFQSAGPYGNGAARVVAGVTAPTEPLDASENKDRLIGKARDARAEKLFELANRIRGCSKSLEAYPGRRFDVGDLDPRDPADALYLEREGYAREFQRIGARPIYDNLEGQDYQQLRSLIEVDKDLRKLDGRPDDQEAVGNPDGGPGRTVKDEREDLQARRAQMTPDYSAPVWKRAGWMVSDHGHSALDGIGLIPVVGAPADAANAIWYASDGEWVSAGLSAASALPIEGWIAAGLKRGKSALEIIRMSRMAGRLEELLKLGRLDRKAIKELEAAGELTSKEAKEAEAALEGESKAAKDGEAIKEEAPGGQSCSEAANRVCVGEPVAIARGEYVEDQEDFRLDGTIPVVASRHYGHQLGLSGPLGRNRTSPFDTLFLVEGGGLIHVDAQGRRIPFDRPFGHLESRNRQHRHLSLTAPWLKRLVLADRHLRLHYAQGRDRIYRLEAIEDLSGNRLALVRDAAGLLLSIVHSDGFILRFENDAAGLRRGVTLVPADGSEKRLVEYGYDGSGNLLRAGCATAPSVTYAYDPEGRLERWHDDSGRSAARLFYDDRNRVVRTETTGPCNDDRFDYDPENRVATYRPGNGDAFDRFRFDEAGNLLEQENALGQVRRYEYQDGYCAAVIDPAGHRTEYSHDTLGNVTQVTNPEGRSTLCRWGPNGELDIIVDGAGKAWRFEHDAAGRVVAAEDPAGAVTRFDWTTSGRLSRIRFADGAEERRLYDEAHRLVAVIDAKGGRTAFAHDAFGRVVRITDALGGETRLHYDDVPGTPFDAPTRVTRPDGVELSHAFDAEGQMVETVDGEGRRTRYRYGAFDQLAEIIDPKGGRLRLTYDVLGRLDRVENANGRTYAYERDLAGRVVAEVDFDGRRIEYAYDVADQLIERRDVDGGRIAYRRDKAGLLLKAQAFAPGAEAPEDVTRYGYDRRGQLVRAESAVATVALERDAHGRVIAETMNGRTVASRYDVRGNRIERRIGPAGGTEGPGKTRYAYDPLGLLAEIAIGDHAPLAIARDPLGREVMRSTRSGFRLEQAWDPVGQLLRQAAGRIGLGISPLRSAGIARVERRYAWDQAFAPISIDDSLWGGTRYAHDANGQIEQARFGEGGTRLWDADEPHGRDSEEHFAYDPAHDIASSVAAGGRAGWLRTSGGKAISAQGPRGERVSLTHDARGRVTERRVERDGFRPRHWRYDWDTQDRLVRCRTPDDEVWRYGYDPFGRRIWKRREGPSTDAVRRVPFSGAAPEIGRAYSWDGDVVAEDAPITPDGAAAWDRAVGWHFEPGTFRPLARTQEGRLHWVVTDHLGTPRELFDEAGGLAWAASHHVWGDLRTLWRTPANDIGRTQSLVAVVDGDWPYPADDAQFCPIRFQGQWADADTGLCYNRFRHYDPQAGEYASRDLIGLGGGLRLHGYVGNPLRLIDPLGLAAAANLPQLKGKSVDEVGDILNQNGFTLTHQTSTGNQTWKHPDGSEVRVHPYGNVSLTMKNGQPLPKSGANAHVHKLEPGQINLDDRGISSTNPGETHIGIANPSDYPQVRNRPHGCGV